MTRVAAVGLDAAEWEVVHLLVGRGDLPHLGRIFERGAVSRLRNEALYRTGIVWKGFLADRSDPNDPAAGGLGFDPATYAAYQLWAGSDTAFFSTDPPIRSISLDVPSLSRSVGPGEVRVNAWGAHALGSSRASVPAGLLEEIDDTFGIHPGGAIEHAARWHDPAWINDLAAALALGVRRRLDIATWLQDRFPDWELFVTVMSEPHSAGEAYWHGMGPGPLADTPTAELARTRLFDVYRAIDSAIGDFVDRLPPDTLLVVFALHGAGPNSSDLPSMVLLPELLHRLQGGRPRMLAQARAESGSGAHQPVVPPTDQAWHDYIRERFDTTGSGGDAVMTESDLGEFDPGAPRYNVDWQVAMWYRDVWPRMRAFALPSFYDGRVRINLEGREASGVVPLGDYERACAQVEAWLSACRDPRTGAAAVTDVRAVRAADPLDPTGPDADLVIRWADHLDALEHPDVGRIGPFPFRRTGSHTPRGFALFSGPGIRPADLGERSVDDLAPTILALLGHPRSMDLVGTPMLSASPV